MDGNVRERPNARPRSCSNLNTANAPCLPPRRLGQRRTRRALLAAPEFICASIIVSPRPGPCVRTRGVVAPKVSPHVCLGLPAHAGVGGVDSGRVRDEMKVATIGV